MQSPLISPGIHEARQRMVAGCVYLHELVSRNFGIRVPNLATKGEYSFMVEFTLD